MLRTIFNIYHLGIKELRTLLRDKIMLFLIIHSFSFAIYISATASSTELHNAPIAFVDEDRSMLSQKIMDAFYKPRFLPPKTISYNEMDKGMDAGVYTFVVVIPSHFERDILKGIKTEMQLNIDATRMTQAGIGAGYIQQIVAQEVGAFLKTPSQKPEISLAVNYQYNPNLESSWFGSINEVISNIMTLSILLSGAALMREREHGTIEHLLVMPLSAVEIMLAKVWSMGLVILLGIVLSLKIVVETILQVPLSGSMPLFLFSSFLVLFSTSSIGIFMGSVTKSMPQLGMMFILVILPLLMLSGGVTPYESMPVSLQYLMSLSPTSHYINVAQAILFRGAGFEIIWKDLVAIFFIGLFFFLFSLLVFKRSLKSQS